MQKKLSGLRLLNSYNNFIYYQLSLKLNMLKDVSLGTATRFLTKSDIRLLSSKLKENLLLLKIEIIEPPDLQEYKDFVIDEKALATSIHDVYKARNPYYDEVNDYSIQKDIQSLSSVCALRRGKKAKTLKEVEHLFLTTNTGLFFAERQLNGSTDYIPVCMSDILFGTLLWVLSPAKLISINEKKIIADCVAALCPNDLLIHKFCAEVERLSSNGDISEDDAIILRAYDVSFNLLGDKTFGDPESFTDRTVHEIIEEIKENFKKEGETKFREEQVSHGRTREEINKINLDNQKLQVKVDKLTTNINTISKYLSYGISTIVYVILICLSLYAYGSIAHSAANIIISVIGLLSAAIGLFWKIRKKLDNTINKHIKDCFIK
jgi:hypothetical protein